MPLFLPLLGLAAAATLLAGCSENSDEPPPPKPCESYGDSKSICTLTFKPAGAPTVKVGADEFIATEANLTPSKLYPKICSEWRPGISLYTSPSNPYPKGPDDLLVVPKSGIRLVERVGQSEEPYVECSERVQPGDPWGILTRNGDFHGIEPNQFFEGLKAELPGAESISPQFQFRKINDSPREIAVPFSVNDQSEDKGPLSFGVAKASFSKIDPSQPKMTPEVSILTKIDIDRASNKGKLYWATYVLPSELLYVYRYENVLDTKGKPANFNRVSPAYTFVGDFKTQQTIQLPEKLNYDPLTETTQEGKPWSQYTPYVSNEFSAPVYQNKHVWITSAPELSSHEELWQSHPTLQEDLAGVHYQTADATLWKINVETKAQTYFRIPLRGNIRLAGISGTDQVAVVGFAPPYSFKKINRYGKEIEGVAGIPTLLRIDSDGKILQTLPIGKERAFLESLGIFYDNGLSFFESSDSYETEIVYKNGQFEHSFQKTPKVTAQTPLLYEEWDRGGTPLQLESTLLDQAAQFYLFGGSDRDYTLFNAQNRKAISWRLLRSEDPENSRSQPCYNAAFRSTLTGSIQRDEEGNPVFNTKTCKVEQGPALIIPTMTGLKIFIGYNDEVFEYQIPNEMLVSSKFEWMEIVKSITQSRLDALKRLRGEIEKRIPTDERKTPKEKPLFKYSRNRNFTLTGVLEQKEFLRIHTSE